MLSLIEKIIHVLKQHFPDADVDLERSETSKKIGGFLVWKGFQRKDHVKRQALIWKVLERELSRDEQLKVSAIFALTPEEDLVEK